MQLEYKRGQIIKFKGQESHIKASFQRMYDIEHGLCEVMLFSGTRLIGEVVKSLKEIESIEGGIN